MAGIGFGGGGDDRLGEFFVLTHAVGKSDAADFTAAGGIVAPCRPGEVAAYDHFHPKAFGLAAHGDHGIGSGDFPVGHDVGGGVEEFGRDLVEHLSFEGYALGEDYVEGRDAVRCDHDKQVGGDVVDVAHFAVIHAPLTGEVEICCKQGGHDGL